MQADIKYPATGIETFKLMLYLASPIITNSVIPIVKPPNRSDSKLFSFKYFNHLHVAHFINSNLRLCSLFANLEINKP
jgi:hypothetical protein